MLEVPAAGGSGDAIGPVAGLGDFFFQQPARGFGGWFAFERESGDAEGAEGDGGVPDRGEAGLHAGGEIFFDDEGSKLLLVVADFGTVVLVAQALEGDDAPDDGREDGP